MEELERRQTSSFLEAEGLVVPTQMRGHEVTKFTRIALMEIVTSTIHDDGYYTEFSHFRPFWLQYFNEYGDDYPNDWDTLKSYFRSYIQGSEGMHILAFIQAFCRQRFCSADLFETLQTVLQNERLGYRLVGGVGDPEDPPTLMPVATEEQGRCLQADYARLAEGHGTGSQRHLRAAAQAISEGQFKASIRESIHAVESAAKAVSGKDKATLPDALTALEKQKPLHPALRQSLSKLYGWTSDEAGIRHAEIGPSDEVPEAMALFMLSSCAAFSAWLVTAST